MALLSASVPSGPGRSSGTPVIGTSSSSRSDACNASSSRSSPATPQKERATSTAEGWRATSSRHGPRYGPSPLILGSSRPTTTPSARSAAPSSTASSAWAANPRAANAESSGCSPHTPPAAYSAARCSSTSPKRSPHTPAATQYHCSREQTNPLNAYYLLVARQGRTVVGSAPSVLVGFGLGGGASTDLGCEPVGDGRRSVGVCHGLDLLETFLVAAADAFVLAQVFIPGPDDELLEDAPGVGRVAPDPPAHRAGPPARTTSRVQGPNQVLHEPGPGPVFNRDLHRSVGARGADQRRARPVGGRQDVCRWDLLSRQASLRPGD